MEIYLLFFLWGYLNYHIEYRTATRLYDKELEGLRQKLIIIIAKSKIQGYTK